MVFVPLSKFLLQKTSRKPFGLQTRTFTPVCAMKSIALRYLRYHIDRTSIWPKEPGSILSRTLARCGIHILNSCDPSSNCYSLPRIVEFLYGRHVIAFTTLISILTFLLFATKKKQRIQLSFKCTTFSNCQLILFNFSGTTLTLRALLERKTGPGHIPRVCQPPVSTLLSHLSLKETSLLPTHIYSVVINILNQLSPSLGSA